MKTKKESAANRFDKFLSDDKPQHTPTPWRVADGSDEYQSIETSGSVGECIADFVTKQDAAFIVRACNSFDALLSYAKRRHLCGLGSGCEECEMISRAEGKERV